MRNERAFAARSFVDLAGAANLAGFTISRFCRFEREERGVEIYARVNFFNSGVSIFCPQYWCKHSEIKAYHRKWQKDKYDSLDGEAKLSFLDTRRTAVKKTLKYKEKLALQGAL